jgi:peptidyl-tRNA hydrolase
VNTILDSKYLIILLKRTLFVPNSKLGALAEYTNSKEEHFSLKPNTYMNLSGKVQYGWKRKHPPRKHW